MNLTNYPADRLVKWGRNLSDQYAQAFPFPSIALDDVFDYGILDAVWQEFPPPSDPRWKTYRADEETGKQEGGPTTWGSTTRILLRYLTEDPGWVSFVENLTGIPNLTGSTLGGGYHQIPEGGRLAVHTDYNVHPDSGQFRRVNLLLYLNPGWTKDLGGCLELHPAPSRDEIPPVVIVPEFGRLVVFSCSDRSYHGHPVPIASGAIRRSVAVYYFSPEPPEGYKGPHSTIWKETE